MNGLITSDVGVLAVLMCMIGFALYAQRIKFFSKMGPAIIVIFLGIILSNTGMVTRQSPVFGVIMQYAVFISIPLLLMDVDLKAITKLSKQPVIAMALAVLSVSFVAILAGLVFATKINEGWKIAGMFVGTYTGGSSNLTAIGMGLDATAETFAVANTADYVVGLPSMILFFTIPPILKNSKKFKKIWPYRLSEEQYKAGDQSDLLLKSKEWSIMEIGILIGLATFLFWTATILSSFFPEGIASAAKILILTTISILAAQFKQVSSLKGNKDLGMFFGLMFLCVIGFMVDLSSFFASTLNLALYCAIVIFGTMFLHILLCRLFKINYEYVVISIVAAIGDGMTAAILAVSAGWESLVSIAIVLGLIGAVLGNYIGIPLAFFLKSLIGG